ncbi:MAG TPA: tetratricopeptide repeat protein [Chthoniobacterales bacterium]|nr:tetratricopeptide repeat protein [Chthoniobacterales bacterium]
MRRVAGALLAVVCLSAITATAADADAFASGNAQYAGGRFREAADLYEQVVASGETSASVFYNLGNAWYRTGDFGRAILNYQRALALEPRNPEAAANLRLARDKARALELRETWWERLTARATTTHYVVTAASGFWALAFCIATLLLRRRRSASLIAAGVFAFLTCAIGVTCAYVLETGTRGRSLAIVVGKKVDARLATADNANTVLTLPAGSEIKVLSTRGDWIYAALPNELRGWIPAQAAERVRL